MKNLLLAFLLLTVTGATGCSSIFFFPQKQHLQTPDLLGLDYEDIYLTSADETTLHGWWLKAQKPVKGTVYFLHGNAENISTHIRNIAWLPEYGYQVFLIDYRGFGLSGGKPTLPGALPSALAAPAPSDVGSRVSPIPRPGPAPPRFLRIF